MTQLCGNGGHTPLVYTLANRLGSGPMMLRRAEEHTV